MRLEDAAKAQLAAAGFRLDYLEIRRVDDLQRPAPEEALADLRIFAAAGLGRARLIDNLPLVSFDARRRYGAGMR